MALSAALACAGTLTIGACLPGAGPALLPNEDGGDPSNTDLTGDSGLARSDVDLGDPFALEGVTPSHGPFTGGTRANLSGRGFSSKLHVFLGGIEVPPASVLASDPTRAAIVTPPGPPGFVDIRIRDDATAKERVLVKGFYYDAFVVQPDSGATSGGTRITLTGSGTSWSAVGTKVAVGGVPCANVVVGSATRLECVTPAGAPGAKDVTVTTADGKTLQARDAFTYSDSVDGYRGGLSGGAFSGRVRVLAFDAFTGTPIADAKVIAGSSLATAAVQSTANTGVTEFNGLSGSKITVTVGAKCHQPMTYVDVPVDTVTMYLQPVLDPACAEGDPPSTGGGGGKFGGIVDGNLMFPGGAEFQRTGWTTVPAPTRPTERRVAALASLKAHAAAGTFQTASEAEKHGTVGAVALDRHGNLAAATSTGGFNNKPAGRVGDTPILGAGTYARNGVCAVSGTGQGEVFIKRAAAYDVAARMMYAGQSLDAATKALVFDTLAAHKIGAGMVACDASGTIVAPYNTLGMYRGWVMSDGACVVATHAGEFAMGQLS